MNILVPMRLESMEWASFGGNSKFKYLQVDMFSVGIVAFELYRPFRTNMEKVQLIQQLKRSSGADEELKTKYPIEVGNFI